MTTDTKERPAPLVHFLRHGLAVCRFSHLAPKGWPIGHSWTGEPEAVTCEACRIDAAGHKWPIK